jgi:two-component system LytT family response regulator
MKKIRTLIIEDEVPAREILQNYLKEIPEIEVVGEAHDGFSGIKAIAELKPDLIFLDIQMPKLTGFEMLELIDERPEIIFTTAYDQYALKAFELNAVDYLMKPFHKTRLIDAVQKAAAKLYQNTTNKPPVSQILAKKPENSAPLTRIVVKKANAINIIPVDEIKYFAAEDDYVMIYHTAGKALKQQTMKYYEDNLSKEQFVRAHRSYIVKISEIKKIEPFGKDNHVAILNSGERIPISKSGFSLLKQELGFN